MSVVPDCLAASMEAGSRSTMWRAPPWASAVRILAMFSMNSSGLKSAKPSRIRRP